MIQQIWCTSSWGQAAMWRLGQSCRSQPPSGIPHLTTSCLVLTSVATPSVSWRKLEKGWISRAWLMEDSAGFYNLPSSVVHCPTFVTMCSPIRRCKGTSNKLHKTTISVYLIILISCERCERGRMTWTLWFLNFCINWFDVCLQFALFITVSYDCILKSSALKPRNSFDLQLQG